MALDTFLPDRFYRDNPEKSMRKSMVEGENVEIILYLIEKGWM